MRVYKKLLMMKITFILFLISFFGYTALSQTDSIPIMNTAFKPGEFLRYKVNYGLIGGGYAEMRIDMEQVGYDWYYRVNAIAKTEGAVKVIAKVSDRYESVIDINSGLPLFSIRDINEAKYRRYNEVIFARDRGTVISLNSGEHKVPDGILDILSAFYFARRIIFDKQLYEGQIINLTTYFDDEIYDVKVKYLETERIKTDFGKFNCLKFVPVLDMKTSFKKEEDLQVWFSDDGNFIPVKIRLKMGISTVKCDLVSYEGLKNPLGTPFNR
jgi:hypothetical protein